MFDSPPPPPPTPGEKAAARIESLFSDISFCGWAGFGFSLTVLVGYLVRAFWGTSVASGSAMLLVLLLLIDLIFAAICVFQAASRQSDRSLVEVLLPALTPAIVCAVVIIVGAMFGVYVGG